MKTIVLDCPGHFSTADRSFPQPNKGEALVRIRRVGVCGTDLRAFRGKQPFFSYPRVPGHELAGEIIEVGENADGLKAGDRCAIEPYMNCGACTACRRGRTNCCARLQLFGVHIDGGMCEQMAVPTSKLHRSDALSLDQLALVEPLSIGAHAVARAQIEAGEYALVVGAGPIGLSVIQFAAAAGARVIVMDINRERLDFAARHFNVEATIEAGNDAAKKLLEITSGDMPTLVFEATGNPSSMNASFDLPSHGGRIVLVGLFQGDLTFHDPDAHRRELTIICSRNATAADFRFVMNLLEENDIDIDPWITHRATLDDLIAQFQHWLDPRSRFIKAVVEI
ncbi:MAG: zinc-binding alcohol dehydrogenase family protein [Acidobacteria bacterium]|nr:zinc-binding alcohol dehydrogenase family protein [Acidobacteriota bacterium]